MVRSLIVRVESCNASINLGKKELNYLFNTFRVFTDFPQ